MTLRTVGVLGGSNPQGFKPSPGYSHANETGDKQALVCRKCYIVQSTIKDVEKGCDDVDDDGGGGDIVYVNGWSVGLIMVNISHYT